MSYLLKISSPNLKSMWLMEGAFILRKTVPFTEVFYGIDDLWKTLHTTRRNIAYAEKTLLYARHSDLVQRHLEKASAITSALDKLTNLPPGTCANLYLQELSDKIAQEFSDVIPLIDDFETGLHPSIRTDELKERKEKIRIHRDLLLRGRMLRRFFRRSMRDIRRHFRTQVRTLFKYMNDQSGTDEFWMEAIGAQPKSSSLNRLCHGQRRNLSPHRTYH